MGLETATYIPSLVISNPDGGDQRSTADDHIRLLKSVLKRNFPLLDGAVSLSHLQMMRLNDVSASVQYQLNQLRDGSATANNAIYANSASYAGVAGQAASASFATLAATANSASYAALAGQAASASFATLAETANSASYAALAGTASLAALATLATTATTALSAASCVVATTAISASSAATLGGLSGSASGGSSNVVLRDGAGDIFARYFNQASNNSENPTPSQVLVTNGSDNYLRKSSLANLGANMAAQNITGRAGTAKTLAAGSGPPSLTGSTNGDMWFYY